MEPNIVEHVWGDVTIPPDGHNKHASLFKSAANMEIQKMKYAAPWVLPAAVIAAAQYNIDQLLVIMGY